MALLKMEKNYSKLTTFTPSLLQSIVNPFTCVCVCEGTILLPNLTSLCPLEEGRGERVIIVQHLGH
jgi:hypothetical protein